MHILTLHEKVMSNSFFSIILKKTKKNPILAEYKIKNNIDLYNFINENVVEDIKLFLNKKSELTKSTKYIIQTVINEILPSKYIPIEKRLVKKKIQLLPFGEEFVVYYLNILNNLKGLLSEKTDFLFEGVGLDEHNNEAEENAKKNQDYLFRVILDILGENIYVFIKNFKTLKQNAVQQTEIENISNNKNLSEDIQKIIAEFAHNQIRFYTILR